MDTPLPALRVLLIEDNPGDARLVQMALAEHVPGEFALTTVERLAHALARIGAEPFDAVLCDLGLPDSEGLATAQAVVARAPALPLVVLTSPHNKGLGREAIELGAQDYLIKDNLINGESGAALLARALRYAIARKNLEKALREANESLEQRVAERTAELQKELAERKRAEETLRQQNAELSFADTVGIDRELAMIDLKRQVNALSAQLGRAAPYDVDFAGAPPKHRP